MLGSKNIVRVKYLDTWSVRECRAACQGGTSTKERQKLNGGELRQKLNRKTMTRKTEMMRHEADLVLKIVRPGS